MPPLSSRRRNQHAVLWPATGGVDRYGEPKLGLPVQLRVRWVSKIQETPSPTGEPQAIEVLVVVDRKIPIGSKMWKGKLTNFNDATETEILWVRTYSEVPDLKGRTFRRTVGLSRFREDLPSG